MLAIVRAMAALCASMGAALARRSNAADSFTASEPADGDAHAAGAHSAVCSCLSLAAATSISRGRRTAFFTARISAMTLTAISGGVLLPM